MLGSLWGVCKAHSGRFVCRVGGAQGRGRLYFRGESEPTREPDLHSVSLPFLHFVRSLLFFLFNANSPAFASQQIRGHFV